MNRIMHLYLHFLFCCCIHTILGYLFSVIVYRSSIPTFHFSLNVRLSIYRTTTRFVMHTRDCKTSVFQLSLEVAVIFTCVKECEENFLKQRFICNIFVKKILYKIRIWKKILHTQFSWKIHFKNWCEVNCECPHECHSMSRPFEKQLKMEMLWNEEKKMNMNEGKKNIWHMTKTILHYLRWHWINSFDSEIKMTKLIMVIRLFD